MRYRTIAIILLVAFFLTSCSVLRPSVSPSPIQGITKAPIFPSSAPEITATFSLSPTYTTQPTPILPSVNTPTPTSTDIPTISPTYAATNTPDLRLRTSCLEILPELPPDANLKGTLLYGSLFNAAYPQVFTFLNLETGSQYQLSIAENEQLGGFDFSPDQRFWSYLSQLLDSRNYPLETSLMIVDSQGQQVAKIPYIFIHQPYKEEGDYLGYTWLDNQRLIFEIYMKEGLVLNPFSGQQETPPSWAELYRPENGWHGMTFDPTLTRIVYPGETLDEGKSSIVLWDVQARQIVVNVPTDIVYNYLGRPVWNRDGSQFAISLSVNYHLAGPAEQELFTISRDGEVKRWTYLTEHYNYVILSDFRWSPDERYIAFGWTRTLEEEDIIIARLGIVDTQTSIFTDYCIPYGSKASYLFWSPDGQQVLVSYMDQEQENLRFILVDIFRQYAAYMADDMGEIIGWMSSVP